MKGLPMYLQTRQDWLNAFEYTKRHPTESPVLKERLRALLQSRTVKVLRGGVQKSPEDLLPEDFEDQLDPSSPFALSGLSEAEIQSMIDKL